MYFNMEDFIGKSINVNFSLGKSYNIVKIDFEEFYFG